MSRGGLPAGKGTSVVNDVADPHPSNEEGYDRKSKPGGAKAANGSDEPVVNSYAHDGKAPPRPKNKGSGAQ